MRIEWAWHVVHIERCEMHTKILVWILGRPFVRPKVQWKIILEWILGKHGVEFCTGFICLRIRTGGKSL